MKNQTKPIQRPSPPIWANTTGSALNPSPKVPPVAIHIWLPQMLEQRQPSLSRPVKLMTPSRAARCSAVWCHASVDDRPGGETAPRNRQWIGCDPAFSETRYSILFLYSLKRSEWEAVRTKRNSSPWTR